MKKQRPNPEKLLERAQEEERQERRGKLKIYLGAAPGVGKTHTMLEDAIEKHEKGLDVVVGLVEAHGRKEIEFLTKQLEVLPRQIIDYHGKQLSEFDLNAALKRSPGLILIDEMAHNNAPGLRHKKRWQDIKEVLDRGIDIYTTLNVQHIESLNDVVSQIIQTQIKETVPDSLLELADTIELVDLPPEDLLKRLQEGKIYFPEQAEIAKESFFRKGNLIALRELALRVTAERVGAQVLLYRHGQGIERIWPTKEKILVCIGPGAEAVKLIRTARRVASNFQAEWIAVHVETPRIRLSDDQRNNIIQNLRLAEQLGAHTQILTGFDVVKEIMNFSREQNVTTIVIGKRIHPRWRNIFSRSLTDELVRYSHEIDVYIITEDIDSFAPQKIISATKCVIPWRIYGISTGIVVLATIIDFLIFPFLSSSNLVMVYLLGITFVALFGRIGPSILASILSVLTYDFFFVPPRFSFSVSDVEYFFTLVAMLFVTLIISNLTILTRRQVQISHFAERHTAALHTLSRQLASTRGVDKLLTVAAAYIAETFESEVIVLLPKNSHLTIQARCKTEEILNDKEQSVAQWVYDLGQIAGLGTDTLPFSDALYVPLLASQGTIGVLRLHPIQAKHLFTPEQMRLLGACAQQIALALEVDRLQEQAKKIELQNAEGHATSKFLQSVSHDLRTPLVAAMDAASTLKEMNDELDLHAIKKLGNDVYCELRQLSRLINNILQMTYLEAKSVQLQKEYHSLSTVINTALETLRDQLGKKPIQIRLPADLPEILFDNTLIQEVFINLTDNAIKFTPAETPIEISALVEKDKIRVSIEDHGPGIRFDEVDKLFEKFYRGRMLTTQRGMGLGLAICYSIIKAHGGEIWAENRPSGGAAFRFTLPVHTLD